MKQTDIVARLRTQIECFGEYNNADDGDWVAEISLCTDAALEVERLREELRNMWQPIATAPRDAIIDVWHKEHCRMTDVWWADESWSSTGTGDEDFSHWMPIPAAPSER